MEPFRIFAEYIFGFVAKAESFIKINQDGLLFVIVTCIIWSVLSVMLLLLTKTRLVTAIAPIALQLTILVFISSIFKNQVFDIKQMVIYLALLILVSVLFALKMRTVLIWLADVYIFSFPMLMITGLFLKNFDKLKFITGKQSINLIPGFNGVFGINGIIWGLFLIVLVLLPVIYNIPGRQK